MLETSKNIDISIRLGRTPQPTRLHGHQRALPQTLCPSSSKKAARRGETHDGSVTKQTCPHVSLFHQKATTTLLG